MRNAVRQRCRFSSLTENGSLLGFPDEPKWGFLASPYSKGKEGSVSYHEGQVLSADFSTCASMLQSCGLAKAFLHGFCIHHYMVECGLEHNTLLCNLLLEMYGKCGATMDAHVSFIHIHQPNVISWNFIIKAYAGNRKEQDALRLFEQLHVEGIVPNKFIFVTILSLCASQEALPAGKRVHARIIAAGIGSDVVVRTALVHMYNKCISLERAILTFEEIPERDTVLWNAMILAHAHHGKGKDAFYLFVEMQREGIMPNRATFLSLLSLCSRHEALGEGKWIHSCIIINGYDGNAVVGTALVSMYGKCSSIEDARGVFDKLFQHDVALWNSVISVYAQNEMGEDALLLFNQMQGKGVLPDIITFVSILSACASQATLCEGKQMHVRVSRDWFEGNIILRNALLNMYCKCGSSEDAGHTFEDMLMRDVFSWNAMLAGCIKREKPCYALHLFHQMQQEGVMPDGVTFVSLLSVCAELVILAVGKRMHVHLIGTKYESDVIVGTALVNMYGKSHSPENAEMVFNSMGDCNIFSWNAVMAAYVRKGKVGKALQVFDKMLWEGVIADKVTFNGILSLCSSHEDLAEGKRLHTRSIAVGIDSDVLVGNALINMYGKCGGVANASEVFNKMSRRDLVSWNAMIAAYAQSGHGEDALQVFNQMPWEGVIADKVTFSSILSTCTSQEAFAKGRQLHTHILASCFDLDVVVGNALVNMYGKCDSIEDALKTFYYMQDQNDVTFISTLSVCASRAALEEGKCIHALVAERGLEQDNFVGNALLNMYGKCGSLDDAQRMFDKMQQRDVVSWNIMIAAYSQNGQVQNALSLLQQMQLIGTLPDNSTFVSVLSACSHGGLVEEGWQFLRYMKQQHHLTPSTVHYNCIIDLLGRAGLTHEAEALVNKMPVQPSVISWMALLGACRNQVDIAGGERAAEGLLRLDAEMVAPYVVLSNIYADAKDMRELWKL